MGGKKKTARPVDKKESRFKVHRVWDCPRCGSKACVAVRISRADGAGYVACKGECNANRRESTGGAGRRGRAADFDFTCSVRRLEEPVDVFFKFYEDYRAQRPMLIAAGDTVSADPLQGLGDAGQQQEDDFMADDGPLLIEEDEEEQRDESPVW